MLMQSKDTAERSFQARLEGTEKGRMYVVLPFDPEKMWGVRARYHVRGTINGKAVRGALEQFSKDTFCRSVQRSVAELVCSLEIRSP
jgi:hypothetical protein